MRSGWPHSEHGRGNPEVSWPDGYSDMEYRNGDYRNAAPQAAQRPASGQGAHPYAAFSAAGYGDDGYSDPGYQGPAAVDAGVAGTRTVQGFVESGQGHPGYPQGGYPLPAPVGTSPWSAASQGMTSPGGYGQQGYAGSSYAPAGEIEMAYPPSGGTGAYHGADLYKQPWDYDQPLRYDGEEDAYPSPGSYPAADGYGRREDGGAVRYQPPAYDPAAYNGSEYSMPGINGPGYDLTGIIGTSDFEAVGYDEPSYGRLSYDDPRYESGGDFPGTRSRSDGTRYDGPRFDETRLDNLWLAADDVRREAGPAGYSHEGAGDSRNRSGSPAAFDRGRRARAAETRFDMKALAESDVQHTRLDARFDETRLDNMRALTPGAGLRAVGTAVLAPPAVQPRNWADETSLDHFADLDLTDEPVLPAAFNRTLERPAERSEQSDTAARRAVGRRRGRSGDRRQWMALGAIAVVAVGAIGGVLMKYVFAGPSGPSHQVVAPQTVDGYTRSANLEKQLKVGAEAQKMVAASGGQATGVVSAVYQHGSLTPGAGAANTQMFMFVGGKLAGSDPGASIANFEQTYPGATAAPPGSLGGQAACTETQVNQQSASMCVWFDNDTFGALVSPTMTTAKLAATLDQVRPNLELLVK
jgi:hypothetical protein